MRAVTQSVPVKGAGVEPSTVLGVVCPPDEGASALDLYADSPPNAEYSIVRVFARFGRSRFPVGCAALSSSTRSRLLHVVVAGADGFDVMISHPTGVVFGGQLVLAASVYPASRGQPDPGSAEVLGGDVVAGAVTIPQGRRVAQLDLVAGSATSFTIVGPDRTTTTSPTLPAGASYSWRPIDNELCGRCELQVSGDPQFWAVLGGGIV